MNDSNLGEIVPSPQARRLFNRMVVLSDDNNYLGLEQSLKIGVERVRAGSDPRCSVEITELTAEHWIDAGPDGGWLIK